MNLDILTFDDHRRLCGRLKIACGISFLPQSLNGCRDIGLLIHESFAQPLCPSRLLSQHVEDFRKRRERLHALIPTHLHQGIIERISLKARVCLYPAVRVHDISGICGRDKDLREQRIRIERNRRKHLIKLCLAESVGGRSGLLRKRSERDHHHNDQPDQSALKKRIYLHVFSSFML